MLWVLSYVVAILWVAGQRIRNPLGYFADLATLAGLFDSAIIVLVGAWLGTQIAGGLAVLVLFLRRVTRFPAMEQHERGVAGWVAIVGGWAGFAELVFSAFYWWADVPVGDPSSGLFGGIALIVALGASMIVFVPIAAIYHSVRRRLRGAPDGSS